jgi:YesN/AraC family two-component response regulator
MKSTGPKDKTYSPLISQAVEYIYKNYANDISLEKCAEITNSSYTYLSREFKQETGLRFVEFLNRHRVNKAKSLLIRRDVSMKEIVEQTGFRNYNYFFKVFKDCEGITPSEFSSKN